MRRTPLLAAGITLAVLASLGGWYWHWTGTPEYSLRELGRGFQAHDRLAVEAYVDKDAVARTVVDDMLGSLMDHNSSSGGSAMDGLSSAFALRIAEGMRPTLEAKVRESISDGVTDPSSSAAGRALSRLTGDDVTVVSQRDTLALARVVVPGDSTGSPEDSLTLRLAQRGKEWVVVGVEGARRWLEAMPNERASLQVRSALKSDLRNLASVQESYYADHSRYARSIVELTPSPYSWTSTRGASMEVEGDGTKWQARASWSDGRTVCHMSSIEGRDDWNVPTCD